MTQAKFKHPADGKTLYDDSWSQDCTLELSALVRQLTASICSGAAEQDDRDPADDDDDDSDLTETGEFEQP